MCDLSAYFQIHLLAQPTAEQSAGESMMAIPFEELASRLQQFERLYFEMDGSFVWTGSAPTPWQLDGMVYDCGHHVQRIELKGHCPRSVWQRFLNELRYPQQALIAYDLQTAKFLDIEALESKAWSS